MSMPPGVRKLPDPEAEARRIADFRAGLRTVSVPRRDLDVLLALAVGALGGAWPWPEGTDREHVEAVVDRYGG